MVVRTEASFFMKPWRLQADGDRARERPEARPSRRAVKPGVEGLEGRSLLSTIQAVPISIPPRSTKQPAAYRPPTQQERQFPPYDINPTIESPTAGGDSNSIFEKNVMIGGYTFPYSTIWLAEGERPGYFTNVAQASATGHYAFVVSVGAGSTTLRLFAESSVQDYSNINSVTVNRGNPIVAWDAIALTAIQNEHLSAPEAARDLAILHEAQYDAVASITSPKATLKVRAAAPKGASVEAAANSAGYTALTNLFPSQAPMFVAAEKSALAGLPPKKAATADGLAVGQMVAEQLLALRADDGSSTVVANLDRVRGGLEVPSPLPVDYTFAQVTPFLIASPSAFRPAAPPSVGSPTYDLALSQVESLGAFKSTTRTDDQTLAALFWNEGAGTTTDPAHWNAIAEQVSIARRDTLVKDAQIFAQLDLALADTAIASADAQSTYGESNPVVAIQTTDPSFQPLVPASSFYSYVSDNAAYGAAASRVLSSAFGSNVGFTDTSESSIGETRSFKSFAAAAAEDASSRVWGGVNFSFDVQAGTTLGNQVGQAVLAGFPKGL
jgi:membrane-associated phospholipid phosphatase